MCVCVYEWCMYMNYHRHHYLTNWKSSLFFVSWDSIFSFTVIMMIIEPMIAGQIPCLKNQNDYHHHHHHNYDDNDDVVENWFPYIYKTWKYLYICLKGKWIFNEIKWIWSRKTRKKIDLNYPCVFYFIENNFKLSINNTQSGENIIDSN